MRLPDEVVSVSGADPDSRLTVVLPAYIPDGPRRPEALAYLRTAIQSVISQTESAWVCRIYDNSPDKSVVGRLISAFNDDRLLHLPNPVDIGLLGSLNRGVGETGTEFIGFLHGDDELTRDYASIVLRTMGGHPDVSGLLTGADVIDASGVTIRPLADRIKVAFSPAHRRPVVLEGDWAVARIMMAVWTYSPTLVLRPGLVGDIRFREDNLYAGDTEFIVDLLAEGGRIAYTPERLYRYRRHGDSGTVLMTKDGTRARLETDFYDRKSAELVARGFPVSAWAARARPFSRLASLGQMGRSAAARSYR